MYANCERIWYCIPNYNGYEYSNDGLLRSMKNYIKNPYGQMIKKYFNKKNEGYFFLSDNENNRCKVYEKDIINLIKMTPNVKTRGTYETDISSRNKLVPTKYQKKKHEYIGIPKFTIIDEKKQAIRFY